MNYLKQRKAHKQSERIWWYVTLGAGVCGVLVIINSLIQMAYGI